MVELSPSVGLVKFGHLALKTVLQKFVPCLSIYVRPMMDCHALFYMLAGSYNCFFRIASWQICWWKGSKLKTTAILWQRHTNWIRLLRWQCILGARNVEVYHSQKTRANLVITGRTFQENSTSQKRPTKTAVDTGNINSSRSKTAPCKESHLRIEKWYPKIRPSSYVRV